MGETILMILVLLLSLYGCTELIRRAVLRILKPYRQYAGVLVFPIKGHREDMEYLVRAVTEHSRWAEDTAECLLLVDDGMDSETRETAESLCTKYDHVHFGRTDEIERMIAAGLH